MSNTSNLIIVALVMPLILFSLYIISSTQFRKDSIEVKQIREAKVSAPSPVNINLDSSFNNFKDYSRLTFDKLHCQLYEQKSKHVNPLGKAYSKEYDAETSDLLLSLIKEINKVKTHKNLLSNLKLSKPSRINLDTSKLDRLYNSLLKTKNIIDTREGKIKILKQSFKPSVVSGKQFEIDVERQMINYLEKRINYLRSLKPKQSSTQPREDINKVDRTLDSSETTIKTIILDIDKNKNKIKLLDELGKLQNLKLYWELRLEEVRKCQLTDENYRSGQGPDIYKELQRLGKAQKEHENQGYCMELKKHLVLKLVREFDVIQSDFNCIKEKGKIQSEIKKLKDEIARIKLHSSQHYDPNRHSDNLEQLKQNYNDYSSILKQDIRKVEMGYDSKTLREMIESIDIELQKHRNRLNDLVHGKKTDHLGDDPQLIVNLVNQNIKLQADYCKDFEEYERENQLLRNKIDQISADRSVHHIVAKKYEALSQDIQKSLKQIVSIKERLTGRLKV